MIRIIVLDSVYAIDKNGEFCIMLLHREGSEWNQGVNGGLATSGLWTFSIARQEQFF